MVHEPSVETGHICADICALQIFCTHHVGTCTANAAAAQIFYLMHSQGAGTSKPKIELTFLLDAQFRTAQHHDDLIRGMLDRTVTLTALQQEGDPLLRIRLGLLGVKPRRDEAQACLGGPRYCSWDTDGKAGYTDADGSLLSAFIQSWRVDDCACVVGLAE